jgi:serine/threonine protein kinase
VPIDDRDLVSDPMPTVVRPNGSSVSDDVPETFPSGAASLLRNLKMGAGPASDGPTASGTAAVRAPSAFPVIPGYEIEGELGRGGMGVVYKARHATLRHAVAIKMILASAHAAPAEVARFVAEAEAVATIKHPNVVQVFDLGVTPGPGPDADRPYFVMECVEGGNLSAYLKDVGGKMTPEAAAGLIEAVARGVHAANDAGIVHRDLKPGNILIADCGLRIADSKTAERSAGGSVPSNPQSAIRNPQSLTPKVSDFGLAKRLSSDMTRTQAVMGTPAYMAPEQAGGKAKFVGPQADVYALGVILYQCLTGGVPFEDADPWRLISRVVDETPEPPRARAPHVPYDLELICLKCLEKEPHHRYPTAAALADDLRCFLNHEAVSVRPIGAPAKLMRWARKRPATAGLAAIGVLLAVSIPATVVGVKAEFDHQDEVNAEMQKTADALRVAAAEAKRAEGEAKRAEGEAKRAEGEAQQAKVAAERLAETQELYNLRDTLRTRAAGRPRGWTAETLAELPKAVALARDNALVRGDLRSVAAAALLSDDLLPVEPVLPGMNGSAIATDPKTGRVAVGEFKDWFDVKVVILDPRTGNRWRVLTYPAVSVAGTGLLDPPVQDVTCELAFSPDGAALYAGTRSGRVVRFDLTGEAVIPAAVWQATPPRAFSGLAVSADGKTVYTIARPADPVTAWTATSGKKAYELKPGDPVHGIAALPGGGVVAACGARMHFWDAAGAPRAQTPVMAAESANRVVPGPGSMLLIGAHNRLEVGETLSPGVFAQFLDPALRRASHPDGIRVIAVHPSGAFAATAAADSDRLVKVWELASGRLVGAVTVPGTGPVRPAWSGDGEFLLATAANQVMRWRLAPAAAMRFAGGTGLRSDAATFLPDGRVAVLTEANGPRRELLIGRPGGAARPFPIIDTDGNGRGGVSADPGGRLALTFGQPGLSLWTPEGPFGASHFTKHALRSPRFAADGRTLWATVSTDVRAIDPNGPSGPTVRGVWDNSVSNRLTGLGTIEVLAAGRARAAAATRDGSVTVLDNAAKPVHTFRKAGDPVLAVAVAADDSLVAAGTQAGDVRLMRLSDETELPPLAAAHADGVSAVAFGDGLLATGGRDRTVRLWKRAGDRFEPLLAVAGLPDAVRDLQFHPTDGRLLVLLDRQHAVRVWDVPELRKRLGEFGLGW